MRTNVKVGSIDAVSASAASGLVRIGELADGVTPIQVPIVIMNGRDDGPVIYLHSGSHGQETNYAVEMLALLRAEVDLEQLKGAIIAVPLANLLAHQFATRAAARAAREGVRLPATCTSSGPATPAAA
jgi:predicted deacylase